MSFEYDRTETARIVKRPPSCSCFRMRNNEIISTACKLHDKGFKDVPDKKAPSKMNRYEFISGKEKHEYKAPYDNLIHYITYNIQKGRKEDTAVFVKRRDDKNPYDMTNNIELAIGIKYAETIDGEKEIGRTITENGVTRNRKEYGTAITFETGEDTKENIDLAIKYLTTFPDLYISSDGVPSDQIAISALKDTIK